MNEETFNMSIRKYLKMVGVHSQHEIEKAVTAAISSGQLKGYEKLPAKMTLMIGELNLNVSFDGEISLE
ncbi:MAG: DUF6494 family protein [Methylophilaceae bacterium]|jgi:hypothetical protein|uniref:DUF6494 family protein n=1 Tax=Methylobacillus sp. MM3 TaxID=1848039 RepID=UPI0007DF0AB5|nr:DUF6494 family protein [Methylobacillus sp. MM3]OAJ70225.1 hypothetical protein A7976_00890 [Methylobacillus sp. MM3]